MATLQTPTSIVSTACVNIENRSGFACLPARLTTLLLAFLSFVFIQPGATAQQIAKSLTVFRPRRLGLGALAIKATYGLHTPIVYQVSLANGFVDSLLPTALAPRLHRNTPGLNGKVEKVFMKPGVINLVNTRMHAAQCDVPPGELKHLNELFTPMQAYNYALTGSSLSFSKTGTAFGADHLSKHSIISSDFRDVRFAGQMWRQGDTLFFTGNSGTYMKKRKKTSDLNPAPDHEPMKVVMDHIFSPMLTPVYSNDVAPHFGDEESEDQAKKAIKAAEDAEKTAAKTTDPELAGKLKEAATTARAKAAEAEKAHQAVHAIKPGKEEYLEYDRNAGYAAMEARKARKSIEKLLEIADEE